MPALSTRKPRQRLPRTANATRPSLTKIFRSNLASLTQRRQRRARKPWACILRFQAFSLRRGFRTCSSRLAPWKDEAWSIRRPSHNQAIRIKRHSASLLQTTNSEFGHPTCISTHLGVNMPSRPATLETHGFVGSLLRKPAQPGCSAGSPGNQNSAVALVLPPVFKLIWHRQLGAYLCNGKARCPARISFMLGRV